MRLLLPFAPLIFLLINPRLTEAADLPAVPPNWHIELVTQAPDISFPTAIVQAPDGNVYLGQDPMDMPGPPTSPIDSIVTLRDGKLQRFAEKLWSVMGLEWIDDTLYVVHAPYLSALRDTDGDGKADQRVDLMTGLGPKLPGFSGINDHVASGIRLGMDGFLYIAVGDKGIPKGVGKDGTTIQLFGGGVIRIRPDGTGLEVVSTGERNPLSVALTATDEIFTYGNDDDSKRWPNSLTHHIVGGHYGYPYQFLTAPTRALPIVDGQLGGSGTQGVCYNEAGLPAEYAGNFFFADWGLQTVFRYQLERVGGTFKRKAARTPFITKGNVRDFRPFSLAVTNDGRGFWLVDWAYDGWLADGPKTGRLYRLTYEGSDRPPVVQKSAGADTTARLNDLAHPSRAVRLEAQRHLARQGASAVEALSQRLSLKTPTQDRLHALWALDAIGTPEARSAIRARLSDHDPELRLQAARSAGIRGDREALAAISQLVRDPEASVRREAAIALGKLGDRAAVAMLMDALGETDTFAGWSIRWAVRRLNGPDEESLLAALLDTNRRENALKLADENWNIPTINALGRALVKTQAPEIRSRIVATLAGLYRQYPEWSGYWFGTNPLAGQMPQKTRDWNPDGMKRVLLCLVVGLKDTDPTVRHQAIVGLDSVGRAGLPFVRERLPQENDVKNLALLASVLGRQRDFESAEALSKLALDGGKPLDVRAAALDALGAIAGPQALKARFSLLYDKKAPSALVARVLPPLGREGLLPPNDAVGFLESEAADIRAAALRALNPRRAVSAEVKQAVLSRLDDSATEVRRAAFEAVVACKVTEAIPRLIAAADQDTVHGEAIHALTALPDPRALPVFLEALDDRSPDTRRAAEKALLAIREQVASPLKADLQAGKLRGNAALLAERVLTPFEPLTKWRVIGPFPRTTAEVFLGESSIDFTKPHAGVEGRPIVWQEREGEASTGRVTFDDFKAGGGDRGGFGYDTNGSPDLCAFAYTEFEADRDRPLLLLVGSSGSLAIAINEELVYNHSDFGGRPYAPDTDVLRLNVKKGKNRILVKSRQGIGVWSFSIQVGQPAQVRTAPTTPVVSTENLRAFALRNLGDIKNGESLFFDPNGIGCVKCHTVEGRGTGNVGPDLAGLALKYDKAEIIRSVLEPSQRIATGYQAVSVATKDGKVTTGLVRSETDANLELVDAEARITRIPRSAIDERRVSEVSVMPAGLVERLSAVEFADLISYLQSLKTVALSKPSDR